MNELENKFEPDKIADMLATMDAKERDELLKSILKKKKLLRMLVVILDHEVSEKADGFFKTHHAHFQFKMRGEGTANSEILDLLGLGSSTKTINICIGQKSEIDHIMEELTREFKLRVRGNGIAFILTLSGSVAPIIKMLGINLEELVNKQEEREVEKVKNEAMYELILSVVNQGYSEDVMDAAKSAGATGGTVIHARQMFGESAKVWGITLQGEREIVAIVAKRDQKVELMKAININCGVKSEARGITIALPIDGVAGLED